MSAWYGLVCCIYLVCSCSAKCINQGCVLRVASLPKNEPLLVVDQVLALPNSLGELIVEAGREFNVSCTGNEARSSAGFERFEGLDEMVVACLVEELVEVEGEAIAVQDLGCKTQVKGDIRVRRERCGDTGTSMELGFRVKGTWHGVIQVCHHNETSSTQYVTHKLFGASLPAVERKNQNFGRPKFQTGGVYNFKPNRVYEKKNHAKTLASTLGGTQFAEDYLGVTYLARGHLAPNADFILDSYQDLTFFYINAAPQWQSINNGNWASVEKRVRRFAENQRKTLTIITGTYGVLELEGRDKEPAEIWLYRRGSQKRLPVPHFFWKVVYDPEARTAIAFVSLNMMRRAPTAAELLCDDVCDATGWGPEGGAWRDDTKGYVFCCDVTELKRSIHFMPRLEVNGLLSMGDDAGEADNDVESEGDDDDDDDDEKDDEEDGDDDYDISYIDL